MNGNRPDYGTQPPPDDNYNNYQQPAYEEVYPPKKRKRVGPPFMIASGTLGIVFAVMYVLFAVLLAAFMQPVDGTPGQEVATEIIQIIFGLVGAIICWCLMFVFQMIQTGLTIVGLSLGGGKTGLKLFSIISLLLSFAAAAGNVLFILSVWQNI